MNAHTNTAAFFRVEGVLFKKGPLDAVAYLAANALGFRERTLRLGHVAAAAVGYGLFGQSDRQVPGRLGWASLRGMSEDRFEVLLEDYRERFDDARLDSGVELLQQARRAGHRIVLIAENIGTILEPSIEDLRGIDKLYCNSLEVVDGELTGRLTEPVVGGHEGAALIRKYAEDNDIDLSRSLAYASHGSDLLLLSAVGSPCAVNADFTLRRAATDAGWALMDYTA